MPEPKNDEAGVGEVDHSTETNLLRTAFPLGRPTNDELRLMLEIDGSNGASPFSRWLQEEIERGSGSDATER